MASSTMPPAGSRESTRLRVLVEPDDISPTSFNIVLVPGVGTASPETWPFANKQWLTTLPNQGAGAQVLAYEYPSPFSGANPSWQSLLMLGYDFLESLNARRPNAISSLELNEPILIVCHSLGGVIVKQALCIANKQFARYESIINATAGIILMSTPHRSGDKAANFALFQDVLEATAGRSARIPNTDIEQESTILTDLADRFQGIAFRAPLLSVYELRESKVSSNALRSKYQQLVDRNACMTHAPLEQVIGLNLDHHGTCLFTKSNGGKGVLKFEKFVLDTLENAENLIALRLEDSEYQYATTSAYSPTMSELPNKLAEYQLSDLHSNRVTAGTTSSGFEMIYPPTSNNSPKILHLPCFLVNTHSANQDFCGREAILARLAAELLPSQKAVTVSSAGLRQFALCGFGGIGKTEIAREFVRRHKGSFDAVFWVMADEIVKLNYHYQQISLALGLEDASECQNQIVSREIVKGWLSSPRKGIADCDELSQSIQGDSEATWLIVFDNADDPMILADYWPQGSGSILITSRDPLAKTIFTSRSLGLDLGPLSEQESLSLFSQLTDSVSEQGSSTMQQISNALGGVPLAISQMAGIIRRQDLTLSEFFELYTDHEEHASLYKTKFDTNYIPYRHSLSTVWAFEKLKPQARQLLELISFLDPDIIEEDLLIVATAKRLADGLQFRKSNFIEARTELLSSSLVQRDKEKHQLSVHRIVQEAVLSTMDVETKESIFDEILQILWGDWPSAMPKPSKEPVLAKPKSSGERLHVGRWPVCAAIYPHVLRLHQLWPTIPIASEATNLLFAKLLTDAAWYQKERGRTKHFDGFFETARKICEPSTHDDRDALLADIYFCLGAIAMDASDFDASRIYKEQSLDLVSKICSELGTEDERLYMAYAERGISRIQDKRYEEGEADLKEALRMRKGFGNYIPRSGETNLSWGLLAQGKLDECNTLLEGSLAAREKALGKDDRESVRTGLMLSALGNLRAAQNRWDESFQFHQRALRHMNATVGERDFYTAIAVHKMGEHFARLGQREAAINMINGALDIWSVDPDTHKNEIARSTFVKGKLFLELGKGQKAGIALKVAARLRREITNEDRPVKTLTLEDFNKLVAFWAL